MRPHWSKQFHALSARLARAPRVLIASDFDGTLSPLVNHPSQAAMLPEACETLKKLAAAHPRVRMAFLSGRSLPDLAQRLPDGLSSAVLAGNHGLELRGAGLDWTHPACTASRPDLDRLAAQLLRLAADFTGAEVEDKGCCLTFHYRRVESDAVPQLKERVARLPMGETICCHEGKMILEFFPQVVWHKGLALRRIMQRLGIPSSATIYLGDDRTDEDSFRELLPNGCTVHVGAADATSLAVLNARDPADVALFLNTLADSLYR
jgi:trehalose-phosphatase